MRLGIRATLAFWLAGLLVVAGTVASVLIVRLTATEAERAVVEQQRARASAIAAELRATCAAQACPAAMKPVLERQRGTGGLVDLSVVSGELQVWAGQSDIRLVRDGSVADVLQGSGQYSSRVERDRDHARGAGTDHRVVTPLRLDDGQRMALVLGFALDDLQASLESRQLFAVGYMGLSFLAVLVFGMYVSGRWLVRPIRDLTAAAAQLDADAPDPSAVPRLAGPTEVAELAQAFRDSVVRQQQAVEARQRSLKQLESARDELVRSEKLATVGRLAAGVAHEVGNPLASVVGYVDYLRDERGTTPELQAELLGRIDKELERIRQTVRQLLDFSRPSAPEPERFPLRSAIDGALELLGFHQRFKRVQATVEGDAPDVFAEPARIRQVFVNLLLNAADAMGGEGTVHVTLSADEGHAEVRVSDAGPGVPPEERAHLFEPFYSTKPKGQGTGLGLAICQRLIEEAGGTMALADCEAGATFVIRLPAAAAA